MRVLGIYVFILSLGVVASQYVISSRMERTYFAGIIVGGTITEQWNGTGWTEVADLNDTRTSGNNSGTSTSCIYAGGPGTPRSAKVEAFDGTSWTRFYFWRGYAMYLKHYSLISSSWTDRMGYNNIRAITKNLDQIRRFQSNLHQFINTNDFDLIIQETYQFPLNYFFWFLVLHEHTPS